MKYYLARKTLVYTSTIKSHTCRTFRTRSSFWRFSASLQLASHLSISSRDYGYDNYNTMMAALNLSLSIPNLRKWNIICSGSLGVTGHSRQSGGSANPKRCKYFLYSLSYMEWCRERWVFDHCGYSVYPSARLPVSPTKCTGKPNWRSNRTLCLGRWASAQNWLIRWPSRIFPLVFVTRFP